MPTPIVLAIEPDRRQAAHVSAVVRHRVGAELILADTTEGALDAIGSRVPDLVLVPALLSPQDDAALAAALRVIAAAAHVRTLTIPVFANGSSESEGGGGLLARFRRGRSEAPSVGCDPAVFAEQISEYLREAAAERAELEGAPAPDAALPTFEPRVEESPFIESSFIESPAIEPAITEPVRFIAPAVVNRAPKAPAAPADVDYATAPPAAAEAAHASLDFVDSARAELNDLAFVEQFPLEARAPEHTHTKGAPADDNVMIDLSAGVQDIAPEVHHAADDTTFDGDRVDVYTLSVDETLDQLSVSDAFVIPTNALGAPSDHTAAGADAGDAVLLEEFADVAAAAEAPPAMMVEPAASKPADTSAWLTLGLTFTRQWPLMEGTVVESGPVLADIIAATSHPVPASKHAALPQDVRSLAAAIAPPPAPAPAPAPTPRADHRDWAELVASLRQDIERRRKHPVPPTPIAAPPRAAEAQPRPPLHAVDAAADAAPRPQLHAIEGAASRRTGRKGAPVQDEWGFFDPQQCGFAALLAKLDEFSEATDDDVRKTS